MEMKMKYNLQDKLLNKKTKMVINDKASWRNIKQWKMAKKKMRMNMEIYDYMKNNESKLT